MAGPRQDIISKRYAVRAPMRAWHFSTRIAELAPHCTSDAGPWNTQPIQGSLSPLGRIPSPQPPSPRAGKREGRYGSAEQAALHFLRLGHLQAGLRRDRVVRFTGA